MREKTRSVTNYYQLKLEFILLSPFQSSQSKINIFLLMRKNIHEFWLDYWTMFDNVEGISQCFPSSSTPQKSLEIYENVKKIRLCKK